VSANLIYRIRFKSGEIAWKAGPCVGALLALRNHLRGSRRNSQPLSGIGPLGSLSTLFPPAGQNALRGLVYQGARDASEDRRDDSGSSAWTTPLSILGIVGKKNSLTLLHIQ
jgi:hypothetical protein